MSLANIRLDIAGFEAALRAGLAGNLERALTHVRDQIRAEIDTPGYQLLRGGTAIGTRRRKGVSSRRVINIRRSKPGQAPFEQRGHLWMSEEYRFDRRLLEGWAGSQLWYAIQLELGNPKRRLAPRPHVRPVFYRELGRISALMGAPL